MFVILFLVTGILFYFYAIFPMSYWKKRGVKQTNPWWLFGDAAGQFFRCGSLSEQLHRIYNTHNNVRYLGYYELNTPTLMIKDTDLISKITVKYLEYFINHRQLVPPEADELWSKNLFALEGEEWREMRPILSPAFTSNKMKFMYLIMKDITNNFIDFFQKQDCESIEVSLKDVFTRYANDIIATTAFGVKVNSLANRNNEFYLNGRAVTDTSTFERTTKFFLTRLFPYLHKFVNVKIFYDPARSYFANMIKNTLKRRRETGIVRLDMINLLLEAQKTIRNGKALSDITDDIIVAQALVFFFAGFESVSAFLTFMGYELSINTDVQDKLRNEIRSVYQEFNEDITYEAISKIKYLDMVTTETLRKWPSFAGFERVCTKEFIIEPEYPDEPKLVIKQGTVIQIPVMAIHYDEKHYPDPDRFYPERFSEENKKNTNPNAYLPFGLGPRVCIGNRFALMEAKILYSHLLLHYEILSNGKTPIPMKLSGKHFNVHPVGDVCVTFRRLTN